MDDDDDDDKALRRTPWLTKLEYRLQVVGIDSPTLALASVALLTVVFFVAIRQGGVELSFEQLAAYEKRTVSFQGGSAYLVEVGLDAEPSIFHTMSKDAWVKVSHDVDYVAFIYTKFHDMTTTEEWIGRALRILSDSDLPELGMVLCSCGCVVSNALFRHVDSRWGGDECFVLPGFVLGSDLVYWMHEETPDATCARVAPLSSSRKTSVFASEIALAREQIEDLHRKLANQRRNPTGLKEWLAKKQSLLKRRKHQDEPRL